MSTWNQEAMAMVSIGGISERDGSMPVRRGVSSSISDGVFAGFAR